jgi:hypothetical protein
VNTTILAALALLDAKHRALAVDDGRPLSRPVSGEHLSLGDATDEVNGRDALPVSAIAASSAVPVTKLDGSV